MRNFLKGVCLFQLFKHFNIVTLGYFTMTTFSTCCSRERSDTQLLCGQTWRAVRIRLCKAGNLSEQRFRPMSSEPFFSGHGKLLQSFTKFQLNFWETSRSLRLPEIILLVCFWSMFFWKECKKGTGLKAVWLVSPYLGEPTWTPVCCTATWRSAAALV